VRAFNSTSREHGEANEGDPAVILQDDLGVEAFLFLSIDDDKIEPISEGLEGRGEASST